MQPSKVVLPDPDSPTTPSTSPGQSEKSMSRQADRVPKRLVSPSTVSNGVSAGFVMGEPPPAAAGCRNSRYRNNYTPAPRGHRRPPPPNNCRGGRSPRRRNPSVHPKGDDRQNQDFH